MDKKSLKEKVYSKLKQVPSGKVTTYKDLAKAVNSKAYRAVGSFMKINEDPKGIPCYKVVKSDGSLGNYSALGGRKKKIDLLERDGISVKKNKINLKVYKHNFS